MEKLWVDDIELKLVDDIHGAEMFALIDAGRGYLREWLPWVDGTKSVEDILGFIETAKKHFAANNGFQAGIWYKEKLAGVIGYHGINWGNKSTSIGYWLGEGYQGNGIMTKACKVCTKYAIEELKLNRVEIRCAEKNLRSRAIPERLGFVKEGLLREAEWLYDHYVDHVVYGMLAREYKS